MKIVVAGGTGLIGGKLVGKLRQLGHEVVPASPKSGVNVVTGEGLDAAIAGASVVVDVMNAPSWEDNAVLNFFETTSRNLLAAEAKTGTGQHVALSVVGTDRFQDSGYFRAKLAQEKLIQDSGIPFTIVRATQFFEFLNPLADFNTVSENEVRLPSAKMQPMSADDVATALADYALLKPFDRIVEIAGPEVFGIDEAVRQALTASGDPRRVITDSRALYYGIAMSGRTLTPGDGARITPTRLSAWLNLSHQPVR